MYIILMGMPGAGKGTQAAFIETRQAIPHITSGGLFRAIQHQDTPLARQVKGIMARGELVPDDITIQMVRERLRESDARQGFILDGFPRTLPQADALNAVMTEMEQALTHVLYLKTSDDEVVERIGGRFLCTENDAHIYHLRYNPPKTPGQCDVDGAPLYQRDDDKPESVRERLALYHTLTEPLLDYYRQQDVLIPVNAEKTIEEIAEDIQAILAAPTVS